jgi:DNA-binding NarL/FixJ family response regulator
MTISVLLVGGHEIDHRGLKKLLEGSEVEIVCQAQTGRMGLSLFASQAFDIALIDLGLADLDPLELVVEFRSMAPKQAVMLMALQENAVVSTRAVSLGVLGMILKTDAASTILSKIRAVANNQCTWSREELRRLAVSASAIASDSDYQVPLTQREGEVLQHLSDGRTNKQIAQSLGISYETVKEHVQHILHKIGVIDRTQAAIWAVRRRLV